jgi:hypothetical protein
MKLESITLSLPAHWICPVLYGDTTGLDDKEDRAFNRWLADTIRDVGHGDMPMVGTIKDETYFARYHDAAEYGVLACDCYDVELLVPALTSNKEGELV